MTGEVTRHPFDWGTNLGRGPSEVWRCVGGRAAGKQAARASYLGVTRHLSGSCTARVSSATFVLLLPGRERGVRPASAAADC